MALFEGNQAVRAELKRTLRGLAGGRWRRELFSDPNSDHGVALVCTYKNKNFLVDLPYFFRLQVHPDFGTLACVRVREALFINLVEHIADRCRARGQDMYDARENGPEVKDGYIVFRSFENVYLQDNGPEDVAAATASVFAAKMPARRGEKIAHPCLVVRWTYENGDVYYQKLWATIIPEDPRNPDSLYVEFPVPVLVALRQFSVPALAALQQGQAVGAHTSFTAVRSLQECYDPASRQFTVGPTEAVYVDQNDLIDLGVFAEEEADYWRQREELNEAEEQEAGAGAQQQEAAADAAGAAQGPQLGLDDGVDDANALMQSLAVGDGQGEAPVVEAEAEGEGAHAAEQGHMGEEDLNYDYVGPDYDGMEEEGAQFEAEAETQPVGATSAPGAAPLAVSDLLSVLGPHGSHGAQSSGHGREVEVDVEEREDVVHVHAPTPGAGGGHPSPGSSAVVHGPSPKLSPSPSSSSTSSGHKRGRAESLASAQKGPRLSDASTHAGVGAGGSVLADAETEKEDDDEVEVEEVEQVGEHHAAATVPAARVAQAAAGVVDLYYSDDDAEDERPRGAQLTASGQGTTTLGIAGAPVQAMASGETQRLLQELKQAQAEVARSQAKVGALERLAADKSEEAARAAAELAAVRESSITKAEHVAALQAVHAQASAAVTQERTQAGKRAAALGVSNQIGSQLGQAQVALKLEVEALRAQLEQGRTEKVELQELLHNLTTMVTEAQATVLSMAQQRNEALSGLGQAQEELRQLREAHVGQQSEADGLRDRVAELEAKLADEEARYVKELEAEKERLQQDMKARYVKELEAEKERLQQDMNKTIAECKKSEVRRIADKYTVQEGLVAAPTGQGDTTALKGELKKERDKTTALENELQSLSEEHAGLRDRCKRAEQWKSEKIKSCTCKREQ